MKFALVLCFLITVDGFAYFSVERACRHETPAFKLVPAIGGWMTVAYCMGKGSNNAF